MKRVRKRFRRPVRFYMCGEYGPIGGRPHYHACLFNVDFRDRVPLGKSESGEPFFESAELSALWSHGRAAVQDLTIGTASYCARYIMKKALGIDSEFAYSFVDDDGVIHFRKPEYSAMSLKPGIGALWFKRYCGSDVFPQDFVVADGVKRSVPKYYDKLFRRTRDVRMDAVEFGRYKRARASAADNTDERRAVREIVHLAKVHSLRRDLE